MYTYREPEIEIAARIGVDEETYKLLKKAKKDKKESMVKIVCDLVKEKYGIKK